MKQCTVYGSCQAAGDTSANPWLGIAPENPGVHDGGPNPGAASPDAPMTIIPQAILDKPPLEAREVLTPERAILYALGVGADELSFVYESGLQTLPTLATVLASPTVGWYVAGTGIKINRSVHAEISLVLHAPVPAEGEVVGTNRMLAVVDKGEGRGALLYSRRDLRLASGEPVATIVNANFLLGQGGFGDRMGQHQRLLDRLEPARALRPVRGDALAHFAVERLRRREVSGRRARAHRQPLRKAGLARSGPAQDQYVPCAHPSFPPPPAGIRAMKCPLMPSDQRL